MTLLWSSLRLALLALLRAGTRTLLTALGVLIGIAAVVLVTALGTGVRDDIGKQIDSLGSNLIYVFNRPATKSGRRALVAGLTDLDADAIRREATAASGVTVWSQQRSQVVSDFDNTSTFVMGVDSYYLEVRSFKVEDGRKWTDSEELTKAKVCLIGKTAAENLFGDRDPIGRTVRIGRHPFTIIGTLARKGRSPFEDQDDRLILPIGSFRARVRPTVGGRVDMIIATTANSEQVPRAAEQIEALLRQRHGFAEPAEPDFMVRTQEEFRKNQEAVLDVISWLLVSVAAISLFAGGVGVMNIMLVSVTERTREIGIRMAIGARSGDIQAQFLFEAVGITLFGGLVGVALAAGLVWALGAAFGLSLRLSLESIGVALGTSMAVGVAFGFLPARRAAQLDPIEALRHE